MLIRLHHVLRCGNEKRIDTVPGGMVYLLARLAWDGGVGAVCWDWGGEI